MSIKLKALARRLLPDAVRKPLGSAVGIFGERCVQPVQGLLFDLGGGRFHADGCVFEIPRALTTRAYRACFWKGDYETEERELVRRLIRPEDRVLELGGCLGIVSCVTNRLLADKSKHLVVEGNPKLISIIERNRELNHAGFAIEGCAVSQERTVTFYLHPRFIVGGTTQRQTAEAVTVPGRTLRELHERHGPFNVMIMDIEGSEVEALPAAGDLLREYRLVIVEQHEWAVGAARADVCRAALRHAGLQLVGTAGTTEAWARGHADQPAAN
ncbi:MAG: FkbM family methyltransferase [Verrucomicrobia bacterium]|nr:FkbM family methyltransferase [Verrucomicrobiota bacterium]